MKKSLIILLLFANLAFFIYSLYSRYTPPNKDTPRARPEMNASQISIASAASIVNVINVAGIASTASEINVGTNDDASAIQASAASATQASNAPNQCWLWGNILDTTVAVARVQLAKQQLSATEQAPNDDAHFWLYIPPRDNLSAAQKKAKELSALNVEHALVINQGKWKYAVSIATYSSREAAQRRLDQLTELGVHSVILAKVDDPVRTYAFKFKDLTTEQQQALRQISAKWMGSALHKTPCTQH